jgi:CBS domain-containing protein
MKTKVKDIMTRDVASVEPTSSVTDAARIMQKYNIGSVPVCDDGVLRGIVTDRDIVVRNTALGSNPGNTHVGDVMTSQVITVTPDADVDSVSALMSEKQVRRLPVVENNMLVGMIALGDLAVDTRFDMEASAALTDISMPRTPDKG